jgi:hypothetical protein
MKKKRRECRYQITADIQQQPNNQSIQFITMEPLYNHQNQYGRRRIVSNRFYHHPSNRGIDCRSVVLQKKKNDVSHSLSLTHSLNKLTHAEAPPHAAGYHEEENGMPGLFG